MSGKCMHAYANNDGDLWCSLTMMDYIQERQLCHKCKRREETKCVERHTSGHARTVDQTLIRVKSVIANGV